MKKNLLISLGLIAVSFVANAQTRLFNPNADDIKFAKTHICNGCTLTVAEVTPLPPFQDFQNSSLVNSDLRYIIIGDSLGWHFWQSSNFTGANLTGANLTHVMSDGSIFDNAVMKSVKMENANATQVSFKNTNLANAHLLNSLLEYSDFTGANLTGANLYQANLCFAKITEAQIQSTITHACAMKPDCSGRYPDLDGTPCPS